MRGSDVIGAATSRVSREDFHPTLATYFKLHRRYLRSINLERDLDQPNAVRGYVPTARSLEALRRILGAISDPQIQRAWTLTGVYGTGKSAFAHYLAALCAGETSKMRQEALAIAQSALDRSALSTLTDPLPPSGLVRAVVVGRREPLSWTIARALIVGTNSFWAKKRHRSDLTRQLTDWDVMLETGKPQITDQEVLQVLKALVSETGTNVLLVIDELGKNLEFAAHNQGVGDLYLLQQLAELKLSGVDQVYFLGILHQSFVGYGDRLSAVEQNEWNKIQGRFEDILFVESASQMTRLVGQALDRTAATPVMDRVRKQAQTWHQALNSTLTEQEVSRVMLAEVYPLHPIAALALPLLCVRYAQNDRSLFTFLTSEEPYALREFLETTQLLDDKLPTFKLDQIYDYFVESVTGLASRSNLQRWVEVQDLIQDARDQSPEVVKVLKTIGVLNLITTASNLRATPELVALALCDRPDDSAQMRHWQSIIQDLLQRGVLTHRRQLDELRLWQGSDFNIEAAVTEILEQDYAPLADLLSGTHPLKPLVAQRHYVTTGNLRCFEQRYLDGRTDLTALTCSHESFDGLVVYWLDAAQLEIVPTETEDRKPIILIEAEQFDLLQTRAQELRAFQKILKTAPELQQDKVARREVRHRLVEAKRLVDETFMQVFRHDRNGCWYYFAGQPRLIATSRAFQSALSDLCDATYPAGLKLDNELINRRELTSQGAKARRELIEAMLDRADQNRLGLRGYGPEVAMYYSILATTEIHRQEAGVLGFYSPPKSSGVFTIWRAIEQFCLDATDQQRSLAQLYATLDQPPYGVKAGVIPVLLAAVLVTHGEDVGVYKDGTFIPMLGPEHFELLVKDPARFAVKHFELLGLRSQVFQELEGVLRSPTAKTPTGVRNASLLMVAKPLFSFVRRLPKYTLNTKRISTAAQQVLAVLQKAQEPDELLFVSLPVACGFAPMGSNPEGDDRAQAQAFRQQLVQCLHEIQTAYEVLLKDCQTLLYQSFGVREMANLREDLQVQATPLVGKCIEPVLKRFVLAVVDQSATDQAWLEALVMIVADKPPKSWIDEDLMRFELALSDLARRFKNLEALQKEVAAKGVGFTAKRLTLTAQDGHEVNQVIWVDADKNEVLDQAIAKILQLPELQDDPKLCQGLLVKLSEQVLGAQPDVEVGLAGPAPKTENHTA